MSKTKKKITPLVFELIAYISSIAIFLLSSFCFSSSQYVKKTAETNLLHNWTEKSENGYLYSTVAIEKNDDRGRNISNLFMRKYTDNYSGTNTTLLSVSDSNGVAHFETKYNSISLPYTSAVTSSRVYTNNEEPPRFETVNMNLYKYRTKAEEIRYDNNKYDGFIYIPDYFADYIIEHDSSLDTYDELLKNADKNIFYLSNGSKSFKYKIANVFHIKGFNLDYSDLDKYEYTDYDNGLQMSKYLGGFCFAYNYDKFNTIKEDCYVSMTTMTQTKKYIVSEYYEMLKDYCGTDSQTSVKQSLIAISLKNNQIEHYFRADDFNSVFFGSKEEGWNYLYIPLGVAVVAFVVSIVLTVQKQKDEKQLIKFSLVSFISLILLLLLAFIFKAVMPLDYGILTFFNGLSLALTASISLLYFLIFIDVKYFDKKSKNGGKK